MSTVNLVESFGEFKDLKNIDRVTMMGILEDVFRGVVKRRFGEEANVERGYLAEAAGTAEAAEAAEANPSCGSPTTVSSATQVVSKTRNRTSPRLCGMGTPTARSTTAWFPTGSAPACSWPATPSSIGR